MKKRKLLYCIILFILVSFILTLYNSLNGNPISKFIGKRAAENYLEETYPYEQFRLLPGSYDFKFSLYHYEVIKIGPDPYAKDWNTSDPSKEILDLNYYIDVQGFFKPKVRHDGVKYARIDTTLSERVSRGASSEILTLLQSQLSNLKAVEANVDILRSTLPSDVEWSNTLKLEYPMYMHIVTDATNQSPEEALTDGVKIQELLNKSGYKYSNVTINGNAFDKDLGAKDEYGYVKYSFSFKPDTKLSLKDIDTLK